MKKGLTREAQICRGNLTDAYGDLSGVCGDLDLCEISNDERMVGINVKELIK